MRLYRLAFAVGMVVAVGSFVAGLAGAWRWEGSLPGLDQSAGLLGQRAELEGDPARAIRERRSEAVLNAYNLKASLASAEKLASLGDFEGAGGLLGDVDRQAPGSPAVRAALGWAFFYRKQFAQAELNLREAIQGNPGDAHALAGLGEVLLEQSRHEEAIAAFQGSLERQPDQGAVRNSLGVAYATSGHPDLAVPEFEAAVRLSPGSFEANLAKARQELLDAAEPPQ